MSLILADETGTRMLSAQSYGRTSLMRDDITEKMYRIDIKVDAYSQQSFARAQVLTDAGWATLLDDPAAGWHSDFPSYAAFPGRPDDVKAAVHGVVSALHVRLNTVLGYDVAEAS